MINTSCVISKFDKNCKSYKFVDHAKHELLNYQTKYLYQCNKCFIIYTKDKRLKKELDKFYVAEGYHQDYFENNPNAPYCTFIIAPKINKLRKRGTIWDD